MYCTYYVNNSAELVNLYLRIFHLYEKVLNCLPCILTSPLQTHQLKRTPLYNNKVCITTIIIHTLCITTIIIHTDLSVHTCINTRICCLWYEDVPEYCIDAVDGQCSPQSL